MFNLRIDKKEYETLIDMCSLSLMVAHNAGEDGEHYRKMTSLFSELLKLSHDRENVISDERLDMLQNKYYFPSCVTFYNKMNDDSDNKKLTINKRGLT